MKDKYKGTLCHSKIIPKVKKTTSRWCIEVEAHAVKCCRRSGYVPEGAVGKKPRQLFNIIYISFFIDQNWVEKLRQLYSQFCWSKCKSA